MKFDLIHLFVGCSKVLIDGLEVLPVENVELTDSELLLTFEKYETAEHPKVVQLRENLNYARNIVVGIIDISFVGWKNNKYCFTFKNSRLTLRDTENNKIELTCVYDPRYFEIKKVN